MKRSSKPSFDLIDANRPMVNLRIEVKEASTGKVLRTIRKHNLVVNAGKDLLRDFLHGDAVTGLTHFGVGNGTTGASLAQTDLQGAYKLRDGITTLTETSQQLQAYYNLASGTANGENLTECGLFTAASAGTMYARATHTVIAKTSAITVTYTWNLTWE